MTADRPTGLRGLTTIAPRVDDHRAAARVALSVAVPSLLLVATGHTSWTVFAVFGAFTAMYGRGEPHLARLLHQSRAALLLVIAVGTGALAAYSGLDALAFVAATAAVAGLGSVCSDRMGLRPRGPFWLLFAFGAAATLPITSRRDIAVAVLISAGTAAFALAVGVTGRIRLRGRERVVPVPIGAVPIRANALAFALAVAGAGVLSTGMGIGHPLWSMAAAAVPLSVTGIADRVSRGIHRVVGTLLGLAVTAAIVLPFGVPGGLIAVLIIITLQFATEFFATRNYGLALIFFTPLVVLMLLLAQPADSMTLLIDRAVETLIGTTVGVAVAFVAHRSTRPPGPRRRRPGRAHRPRSATGHLSPPFECSFDGSAIRSRLALPQAQRSGRR